MKLYFAPMEGITGLVCRNAYEACFSGSIEKYFAPFITATLQKDVSLKELRDIIPEKNKVPYLVPQILANRADAFIKTAEAITALGYQEINLNLGCPSKTVVTKRKGAGFLEFPHQVDDFLEEVCDWTQKNNIRFSSMNYDDLIECGKKEKFSFINFNDGVRLSEYASEKEN